LKIEKPFYWLGKIIGSKLIYLYGQTINEIKFVFGRNYSIISYA